MFPSNRDLSPFPGGGNHGEKKGFVFFFYLEKSQGGDSGCSVGSPKGRDWLGKALRQHSRNWEFPYGFQPRIPFSCWDQSREKGNFSYNIPDPGASQDCRCSRMGSGQINPNPKTSLDKSQLELETPLGVSSPFLLHRGPLGMVFPKG